jgi:hypothetical protein
MSKLDTIIARGYFPKELPPAFFTDSFAKYARSKKGKVLLEQYKATDNYTKCTKYSLALPGGHRRELTIPHPASYRKLASLVAANLSRLMKITRQSKIGVSRPEFDVGGRRSFSPIVSPADLSAERAKRRAGASYLLKADISQFYPSLYTHAVGWAIDPKMREKAHWRDTSLLGKKIDQCLMDLDGKVSQGIPIGGDLSYLLAECVLSQVDLAVGAPASSAYRWFDDYEIATETFEKAERYMNSLRKELSRFQLRLNPAKTRIEKLPRPSDEEWQQALIQTGGRNNLDSRGFVKHFDTAFRFRERHPDSQVLLYALGVLFGIPCPHVESGKIAQSCMTQALLAEPGAAQKGFALLAYWNANGFELDKPLMARTINQLIAKHEAGGVSSDVAWALSFCIDMHISLSQEAGNILSAVEDDCIALQTLHMRACGLLPKTFKVASISKLIQDADLDGDHWLLAYESASQSFLGTINKQLSTNPLFADMLKKKVKFYRTTLPNYASVIHPGGAPSWLLRRWIRELRAQPENPSEITVPAPVLSDIHRYKLLARPVDDDLMILHYLLNASPGDIDNDTLYPS